MSRPPPKPAFKGYHADRLPQVAQALTDLAGCRGGRDGRRGIERVRGGQIKQAVRPTPGTHNIATMSEILLPLAVKAGLLRPVRARWWNDTFYIVLPVDVQAWERLLVQVAAVEHTVDALHNAAGG